MCNLCTHFPHIRGLCWTSHLREDVLLVSSFSFFLSSSFSSSTRSCLIALRTTPSHFRPVAEALLANGADVHSLDMNGKSALHYAAVSGEKERSTELVALLLKHGANPHVPDYKNPPVTYAFKPVECCKEDSDYPAVEAMLTAAMKPPAVEAEAKE